MTKKRLPIGKDDFRRIREDENYYVDKTLMIKDFIEYGDLVTLIPRPRRFGKTLNMNMLRDFFDITQDSHEIFDGLAIMKTEYADKINSVPVISLSFKNCTGDDVEALKKAIATEIRREYEKHFREISSKIRKYIRSIQQFQNVDGIEIRYNLYDRFLKILETPFNETIDDELLKESLSILGRTLYIIYGIRPIVLIDEYDNPIIEAHTRKFREKFMGFYSSFLTSILKGNLDLGQAVLTGIQRVAKESIFSKLNNIVVYNVLSKHYHQYFGLTREETSELLDYYELDLNEKVKLHYDGYSFSGLDIYNPWSILNYANEQKLKPYWINTSTNALIKESILGAERSFHRAFEKLIVGGEVAVSLNLVASFAELPRTDTFVSVCQA
ncbi:MAG: AAA family ATPase [Defluviitaleaceae bacterium]|nr:AAA family ATPase [Defluviitaleaceae bacterium]